MNENIVEEFSCEQCGKLFEGPMITFNNQEEFDYHLSLHKKVEKTKGSANSFETRVKIINTSCELTVFDANAIIDCNTCGKRFLNKEYLNKHDKSVHEPQKIEPQKTDPEKIEPPVKKLKTSDANSHVSSAHERKKPHEGKKPHMKDKNNPSKAWTHLQNSADLVKVSSNHTKESANLCRVEPPEKRIKTSLKPSVSDTSLNCNICGKTFSCKEDLSMHVRLVHKLQKIDPQMFKPQTIEPPVKRIKTSLDLCDSDASLHVRSAHERKKPHEGKKPCMKDKNNPYKAQRHLQKSAIFLSNPMKESVNLCPIEPTEKRINTSLKPPVSDTSLNCNICGNAFSNKENLSLHVRSVHEPQKIDPQKTGPQKIEPPVKRTKTSLKLCDCDLSSHVRSAPEREKTHRCFVCGVTYLLKKTLRTHFKNTLHDKRAINCKYCSRYFTQKEIEIHIANVHEGEEPYNCDICEERFLKDSFE